MHEKNILAVRDYSKETQSPIPTHRQKKENISHAPCI